MSDIRPFVPPAARTEPAPSPRARTDDAAPVPASEAAPVIASVTALAPLAREAPMPIAPLAAALRAPVSGVGGSAGDDEDEVVLARIDPAPLTRWHFPVTMPDGATFEAGEAPAGSGIANLLLRDTAREARDGRGDWRRSFVDSITLEPFINPVLAPDGNTYERGALVEALRRHGVSPKTNLPLGKPGEKIVLIPNRPVAELLAAARGDKPPQLRPVTLALPSATQEAATARALARNGPMFTSLGPQARLGLGMGKFFGAAVGAVPAVVYASHTAGTTVISILAGSAFLGSAGASAGAAVGIFGASYVVPSLLGLLRRA